MKKLNNTQITIMLNMVQNWASERMETEQRVRSKESEALKERVMGALTDGVIKLKKRKIDEEHLWIHDGRITVKYTAEIDRAGTPKDILRDFDEYTKPNGQREDRQTRVTPTWSRDYDNQVVCLRTDEKLVVKALDVITKVLLSGDASDVMDQLRAILK